MKPEAVSLGMARAGAGCGRGEGILRSSFRWMKRENVTPQIILYDVTDAIRLAELQKRVDSFRTPAGAVCARALYGWPDIEAGGLALFVAPDAPKILPIGACALLLRGDRVRDRRRVARRPYARGLPRTTICCRMVHAPHAAMGSGLRQRAAASVGA